MTSRTVQARAIQDAVRRILLEEWDPIGVRMVPEAQDEYDGYVGGIYRLLATGSTVDELAEHLVRIEHEAMGLSARKEVCIGVASRLMQIDITSRSA
jgi:hypothetical protein